MKIDSHQHFWNYNTQEYTWMKQGMGILLRDYAPQDLAVAQAEVGFDGSVAVQARMTLDETRWLLELAARHDMIRDSIAAPELTRHARISPWLPVRSVSSATNSFPPAAKTSATSWSLNRRPLRLNWLVLLMS